MLNRPIATIVATGIGAFSSIGRNVEQMCETLRSGKSGIGEITLFDTSGLKIKHAAEVPDYNPLEYFSSEEASELDRTTQFAVIAASEAVNNSGLDLASYPADRVAIVSGVCSGVFHVPASEDHSALSDEELAVRRLSQVKHLQTLTLAKRFGIHGLQASISTACASSSTALAYAYEVLQTRKADVVLVGGSDGLLYVTYAGFYALGAMAEAPASPFSSNVGVSFGEGAGYVVLESLESAQKRGARIHGQLAGYGCTADAYHFTAPHPSGEGLRRAMEAALKRADAPLHDLDYINAHGTGTRDNDTAESLSISDLCDGQRTPPPVSSTKSFTGHTLGAAGILEFITCLIAARENFLPPTVNFESRRAGCDLDYIPNHARPAELNFFLSNSAAFGGVNTVVAGRRSPKPATGSRNVPRIAITGLGVVSPAGCGIDGLRRALLQKEILFEPANKRFDDSRCSAKYAAFVSGFNPRQLTPALDVRRFDLLNQYACVSADLAYSDACLTKLKSDPESIGAVMCMCAGPMTTQEAFRKVLREKGVAGVSAKFFPAIVLSTVGGQVCQSLGIKGLNSTVVDGLAAGLIGFAHGYEMLRGSDKEERMIVVAPDELAEPLFRDLDLLGLLRQTPGSFDDGLPGFIPGEGSFALVLERLPSAQARGARCYAEVLGSGATCDSVDMGDTAPDPRWLIRCLEIALEDAQTDASEISFAVGIGRGLAYEAPEREAFRHVLGADVPVSSPTSILGLALASSGTAALATAALGLHDKTLYASSHRTSDVKEFKKALVFGGSERGNYNAFVLSAAP